MRDWGGGGGVIIRDQAGQGANLEGFQGEEGQSLGFPPPPPPGGAEVTDGGCHMGGRGERHGQRCNVWPVSGSREEVAGQGWGLGMGWPPQQH